MEAQHVRVRYHHIFAIIAHKTHFLPKHKFALNGEFKIYVSAIQACFHPPKFSDTQDVSPS